MLVYDDQFPALDDSFEGDEVALLAVRGGKVDKNFRRNYAWAKYAADAGKLKKIVVRVGVNKDSWVHTVGAVTSAVSGAKLHPAAVFSVEADVRDIGGDKLTKVLEALDVLKAPAPVITFVAPAPVKVDKPKPVTEPEVKTEPKTEGK